MSGLKLVKRKGSECYYIRGTVRGQSIFDSTETRDKEAAEAIRIQTEARLLKESVHGKVSTVTFDEAAASYFASGGSARFVVMAREGGDRGVGVYFHGRKLNTITQADLDKAALTTFPNCNAASRLRMCYAPFIAIWNHAVENQWAEPRKWRRPREAKGTGVVRLKPPKSGTTPTTYDRAAQFVAAMSPAPAIVMTALFFTGMRPIEAFNMRAEDVSVKNRWITLPTSKTGVPRGVPMHEFLAPLFEALLKRPDLDTEPRIFRTPRNAPYPLTQDYGGQLKTAIINARRRSGISEVSPYTARHTVSTQLVVNRVHPHIKDQILGHAVDDMSRHYTNVPRTDLIEAINTLPVPDVWRALSWWQDPVGWTRKLAAGTGKRNDLKKGAVA